MPNIVSEKQNVKQVSGAKKIKPYFEHENILIYKDDILKITDIPNNSVDLIVTSPPYNVDIHYNSHADNLSYEDYWNLRKSGFKNCFELSKAKGDFC